MAQSLPDLMEGAQPRFYRGDETGCLVLHGFTATPAEVGWLGHHLAQMGHTVYVPRLTGHGINPEHMRRMRWQDWYGQALDSYHVLAQQCQRVIVIGHSMGGLLSLLLATRYPLAGLVVAGTPILLTDRNPTVRYARLVDMLRPYTQHPTEAALNAQITGEQTQRGETITGRVHYQRWSSRAVAEFGALERVARARLAQVKTPLLLVYARADETGTLSDADHIAVKVSSNAIKRVVLDEGGHIIFQDRGREAAFAAVADFVAQLTGDAPHK